MFSVVDIGRIFGFPLDGSILYYCGDNDIVYVFSFEVLENEPKGQRRSVLEFRGICQGLWRMVSLRGLAWHRIWYFRGFLYNFCRVSHNVLYLFKLNTTD
jgi:hypothetical protein